MKFPNSMFNQSKTWIQAASGAGRFLYFRPEGPGERMQAIFYMPSDKRITTASNTLADDTWHHVLVRVQGSTGKADIFIDNDNSTLGVSSTSITGTLLHPNGQIRLMKVGGYYSEFIITDGFHDPDDFADFSGANPCPIEPAVTPLIHYRAEEVTALTTIPDQSGNGYDGEFFNSTLASAITTDVISC